MNKDPRHLNIAKHNEQTSKFLYSDPNKQYNDWVVTTSFYSAMHYIYYRILPHHGLNDPKKVINSFDNLFSEFKVGNETKHEFTKRWVNRNLDPTISAYYNSLYDDCRNARYNGYIFDNTQTKVSLKRLEEIQKMCTKIVGPDS